MNKLRLSLYLCTASGIPSAQFVHSERFFLFPATHRTNNATKCDIVSLKNILIFVINCGIVVLPQKSNNYIFYGLNWDSCVKKRNPDLYGPIRVIYS